MPNGDDLEKRPATHKVGNAALSDIFKWWLVGCVVVLVGSLVLFAIDVVAGFVYFAETMLPLWVTVLGVVSVMGLGFGGLLAVAIAATLKSRR